MEQDTPFEFIFKNSGEKFAPLTVVLEALSVPPCLLSFLSMPSYTLT